eukprot:15373304-Alexandrium_andersonii.AAC.1
MACCAAAPGIVCTQCVRASIRSACVRVPRTVKHVRMRAGDDGPVSGAFGVGDPVVAAGQRFRCRATWAWAWTTMP